MIEVKVVGVMPCVDGGEQDDKIVAISSGSPLFAHVSTAAQLEQAAPKAAEILRTWYENYKGRGKVTCSAIADEIAAATYIDRARAKFAGTERPR